MPANLVSVLVVDCITERLFVLICRLFALYINSQLQLEAFFSGRISSERKERRHAICFSFDIAFEIYEYGTLFRCAYTPAAPSGLPVGGDEGSRTCFEKEKQQKLVERNFALDTPCRVPPDDLSHNAYK